MSSQRPRCRATQQEAAPVTDAREMAPTCDRSAAVKAMADMEGTCNGCWLETAGRGLPPATGDSIRKRA
jgi:hypothetical protein